MPFAMTPPPPWLGWPLAMVGGVVAALVSSGCAALGTAIALRKFRRAGEDVHWTERARLAFPARASVGSNSMMLPAAFGVSGGAIAAPLLGLPGRPVGVAWALIAWVGVMLHSQGLERLLTRRVPSSPEARRSVALRWLLSAPQLVAWALIFALIPTHWGPAAIAMLTVGAAIMVFNLRGGWLAVCRSAGLLRPAHDRLLAIVGRATALTGIRAKKVDVIDATAANALAFPMTGQLVFTTPILEVLDDDELTAVTVHELAHLDESRAVKVTRAYVPFMLLGLAAFFPLSGSYGAIVAPLAGAVMIAGLVVSQRVARRMEVRSDRHAHAHEGDAGTYARALEKIHEANLVPAVLKGKKPVHPHLYDRMIAAGVRPTYDRPAAPKTSGLAGIPTVLLAILLISPYFLNQSFHFLPGASPSDDPDDLATRQARALGNAARERVEAGDFHGAENLYRRAEVLDPYSPTYPASLAVILSSMGRCAEAKQQLDMARFRNEEIDDPENSASVSLLALAESTVGHCQPASPPAHSP